MFNSNISVLYYSHLSHFLLLHAHTTTCARAACTRCAPMILPFARVWAERQGQTFSFWLLSHVSSPALSPRLLPGRPDPYTPPHHPCSLYYFLPLLLPACSLSSWRVIPISTQHYRCVPSPYMCLYTNSSYHFSLCMPATML